MRLINGKLDVEPTRKLESTMRRRNVQIGYTPVLRALHHSSDGRYQYKRNDFWTHLNKPFDNFLKPTTETKFETTNDLVVYLFLQNSTTVKYGER